MLKRDGYEVTTAADGEQALAVLQSTPVHVVVTDLVMPRLGGMELLKRGRAPTTPTSRSSSSPPTARSTPRSRPSRPAPSTTSPSPSSRRSCARSSPRRPGPTTWSGSNVHERTGEGDRPPLVGESPPMRTIYDMIAQVADTPSTVLITGESGTGKELIAQALHRGSLAARQAAHQDQLRRHPQGPDRVASSSATSGAPSPARSAPSRAASSWPTAARSSSTRSARSRSRCR